MGMNENPGMIRCSDAAFVTLEQICKSFPLSRVAALDAMTRAWNGLTEEKRLEAIRTSESKKKFRRGSSKAVAA